MVLAYGPHPAEGARACDPTFGGYPAGCCCARRPDRGHPCVRHLIGLGGATSPNSENGGAAQYIGPPHDLPPSWGRVPAASHGIPSHSVRARPQLRGGRHTYVNEAGGAEPLDLPITRRMLGVDLDGSRRIEPAQVGWPVGLDGSRRIQTDRLDDHSDDQVPSDRKSDGRPPIPRTARIWRRRAARAVTTGWSGRRFREGPQPGRQPVWRPRYAGSSGRPRSVRADREEDQELRRPVG
jgi:hypothetical protein